MNKTIEEALTALDAAEADLRSDLRADDNEDAIDECWGDLVQSVAFDCTPAVRRELLRQNGL